MFLEDKIQGQIHVPLNRIKKDVLDHKKLRQKNRVKSQFELTCSLVLTTHRGLVTKIVAVPAPAAAATLAPKVIL